MKKIFTSLNLERYGPIVCAILFIVLTVFLKIFVNFSLISLLDGKKAEFLSVSISLGAILAGFIGVIMGLFMTLSDSKILKIIRDAEYLDILHNYLISSIKGSIFFAILSFLGFFFLKGFFDYYFCFWFGSAVYAFLTFLRATDVTYKIMKYVHNFKCDEE